jgi:hypothetical protein
MKLKEFRKQMSEVINQGYSSLTFDEISSEIDEAFVQVAKEKGWPTPNKGKEWSDAELALVLTDAPTKRNTVKYARLLGRGFGSVEMVYRWAYTCDKEIKAKDRDKDKFIKQIKKIARQVGWRV